jgi:hypothetical protein
LQGCDFSLSLPRVARGAQPWAESFNPIGIEKPDGANQNISRYSTENVEELRKTTANQEADLSAFGDDWTQVFFPGDSDGKEIGRTPLLGIPILERTIEATDATAFSMFSRRSA